MEVVQIADTVKSHKLLAAMLGTVGIGMMHRRVIVSVGALNSFADGIRATRKGKDQVANPLAVYAVSHAPFGVCDDCIS